MELNQRLFTIDTAAVTDRICGFISEKMHALHRVGIVVAFSGGLDSSTTLLLCARAVGKENVTALLLPERQGNPQALHYARLLTNQYDIRSVKRNISPILARLGTYNFFLSIIPFRGLQDLVTRSFLKRTQENPFLKITRGEAASFERKGFASMNSKHRIRAVVTYLYAEQNNLLVVGCAHKSEDMLGLYVKFGVDDSADLMPLRNLYRSHILQLADYLGVPREIIERTPNPDIIPGVSDKYMDILGLTSDTLDLIVYGVEHELDDIEISGQLHLPVEKIREIRNLIAQTDHMRHGSQTLDW